MRDRNMRLVRQDKIRRDYNLNKERERERERERDREREIECEREMKRDIKRDKQKETKTFESTEYFKNE